MDPPEYRAPPLAIAQCGYRAHSRSASLVTLLASLFGRRSGQPRCRRSPPSGGCRPAPRALRTVKGSCGGGDRSPRVCRARIRDLRQRPRHRVEVLASSWGSARCSSSSGVALFAAKLVPAFASFLGWPTARFGGAAGRLARGNARRNPQRTASTAAALMIGLALVTLVAVLGQGIRSSFTGRRRQDLRRRTTRSRRRTTSPRSRSTPRDAAAKRRGPRPSPVSARAKRSCSGVPTRSPPPSTPARRRQSTLDWVAGSQSVYSDLGDERRIHRQRLREEAQPEARLADQDHRSERATCVPLVVKGIFDPPPAARRSDR